MLIKTGDGKILDLIDSGDERTDDAKARTALEKATQAARKSEEDLSKEKSGNKTDSSMQADAQSDAETK